MLHSSSNESCKQIEDEEEEPRISNQISSQISSQISNQILAPKSRADDVRKKIAERSLTAPVMSNTGTN